MCLTHVSLSSQHLDATSHLTETFLFSDSIAQRIRFKQRKKRLAVSVYITTVAWYGKWLLQMEKMIFHVSWTSWVVGDLQNLIIHVPALPCKQRNLQDDHFADAFQAVWCHITPYTVRCIWHASHTVVNSWSSQLHGMQADFIQWVKLDQMKGLSRSRGQNSPHHLEQLEQGQQLLLHHLPLHLHIPHREKHHLRLH